MKRLDEIFNVWYGVNMEVVNMEVVEKGIPFISRTSMNNGLTCYVKKIDNITPNPANTLSIAVSGSVLSTFYQEKEYYSGRDVYIAQPKEHLSKLEMLYYCYVIEHNKFKYNYGRGANCTFRSLLLPEPKEVRLSFNKNTEPAFVQQPLSAQKLELKVEEWKWFDYYGKNGLFDITGSTTTPKDILEESGSGIHPYVTTQAVNNGIEGYYNIATEEGSVFTVDSAVLGFCAYQEKEFSASDHVEKLIPKFICNKYIALFLTTIINREQYRYNYGRKASQSKLKLSKIKLPATTTENGETTPDWQWMEDYIKSLPYSQCL